jgi:hypothetical protein
MHKYHDCIVRFGFLLLCSLDDKIGDATTVMSCSEPLYLLEVSEDVVSCWPNDFYVRVNYSPNFETLCL